MSQWLQLSHPSHSGRLRPHEHTSYVPLGILLAVVGFVLAVYTTYAAPPGPESGSIGLTGTVPADPPTEGATITTPANGQRFTSSPVTVSGKCPEGLIVQVYKNDIFGGSTTCSSSGTYSIKVDLLIGKNVLIARVYDALNQAGPDSNTRTVYYDVLGSQGNPITALDFANAQLLLNTDAVFRGVFPKKLLSMPIEILGGSPPYAVNIQWGDATNKVISRSNNQTFQATHTYTKAGTYQVTIQATDVVDRVAFLTVAVIVNGQPEAASIAAASTATPSFMARLLALWPAYTSAVAIVVSFWLGERREKHILAGRPASAI